METWQSLRKPSMPSSLCQPRGPGCLMMRRLPSSGYCWCANAPVGWMWSTLTVTASATENDGTLRPPLKWRPELGEAQYAEQDCRCQLLPPVCILGDKQWNAQQPTYGCTIIWGWCATRMVSQWLAWPAWSSTWWQCTTMRVSVPCRRRRRQQGRP